MRFRGPLADSYPGAVALVVFALVPYLALTGALTPLTPVLQRSTGLSRQSLELTSGLANAAYAFGTVLAIQFAVHLPGRRMLILYASLFVVGSLLSVLDPDPGLFIAGRILQGGCTSLMLIAAVPPLVVGWPPSKMPYTGMTMNMCIFGGVALGPVIGGVQAGSAGYTPLFWVIAACGAAALLLALATYEDQPPQDPDAPWDWVALGLAGMGCACAFFGSSELQTHPFTSAIVLAPLLAGVGMVAGLVAHQYGVRRPLMPVRQVASTLPVAGIVVAMSAGAASVAAVELIQTALAKQSPTHVAMLFWPEFGGAALTAGVFGVLFRTRWTPVLAFAGMVLVAAGAGVLVPAASGSHLLVAVGAGLLGLGVGASVSPALFIAGFSLASGQIQRVFALIELLRGVAAFMVAPILLHLAQTATPKLPDGVSAALGVCVALAAIGAVVAGLVFWLGRARLQEPDLERWEEGEEPAWESPPIAQRLRTPAVAG